MFILLDLNFQFFHALGAELTFAIVLMTLGHFFKCPDKIVLRFSSPEVHCLHLLSAVASELSQSFGPINFSVLIIAICDTDTEKFFEIFFENGSAVPPLNLLLVRG